MNEENGIKQWKYIPTEQREDAYAKIIPQIQEISKNYLLSNKEEQNLIVEQIFNMIRDINMFPIIYFSEEGIKKEIMSVYEKNDVCFVEGGVYTQLRNGLLLLDYLFPNLHTATTCNERKSMYDRFYNDSILKDSIRYYLNTGKTITNLRTMFFSYARLYFDTPINFPPLRAKIIFEHYCPKDGTIYDYSAGYGGRMLGALGSEQNFKYIGVEPNKNTYHNLKILGNYIENTLNKKNNYKIYNCCSESFKPEKESIDFIFSCPPFFKKEIYSDEITQSMHNYPDYQDWLDNYVRPTIQNCYFALKENGVYGVDILNYTYCGKTYTLIEDWIKIAQEEGFVYKDKVSIASRFRKNDSKGDHCYLFMKNENYELPDYTPNNSLNEATKSIANKERAKNRRLNRTIGEYDVFGNLLDLYNEETSPVNKEIYKTGKLYNNKYYKIYYGEDIILQKINVKQPICLIDNIYFFSLSDIGRHFNISRQAISQSKQRKAKTIAGYPAIWFE